MSFIYLKAISCWGFTLYNISLSRLSSISMGRDRDAEYTLPELRRYMTGKHRRAFLHCANVKKFNFVFRDHLGGNFRGHTHPIQKKKLLVGVWTVNSVASNCGIWMYMTGPSSPTRTSIPPKDRLTRKAKLFPPFDRLRARQSCLSDFVSWIFFSPWVH